MTDYIDLADSSMSEEELSTISLDEENSVDQMSISEESSTDGSDSDEDTSSDEALSEDTSEYSESESMSESLSDEAEYIDIPPYLRPPKEHNVERFGELAAEVTTYMGGCRDMSMEQVEVVSLYRVGPPRERTGNRLAPHCQYRLSRRQYRGLDAGKRHMRSLYHAVCCVHRVYHVSNAVATWTAIKRALLRETKIELLDTMGLSINLLGDYDQDQLVQDMDDMYQRRYQPLQD